MKQRKLRVTVEGKQYEVLVEDITSGDKSQGAPRAVSTSAPAAAAAPPPPPPKAASSGPAGQEARIAPLAGIVTAVYVKDGDVVKAGDKVCEIEAMKQKNDVVAHRAGTVKDLSVKVGDAVESAQVLMNIV
ncbi:MAG: biotin/lipoyl-binding protein [Magnetococcales bacterium]|nr:biotin/lipoyl-binding protein [Magnetococcales bacterium]MBF0151990.1 biotin/lipoyl-binding protein [Magnetococcales bacterium]MBF0632897.1 biotin/lipoyl-binding protein [Magnetococcales bacterium]